MRKQHVLIFSLIALSSISAGAEENRFKGLFMGVNGSLAAANVKLEFDGTSLDGIGQTSANVIGQIGYGYAATERAVFSIGATYRFSDLKVGKLAFGGESEKIYGKRNYGVYFEPGYTVGSNTLMYALASYEKATGVDQFVAIDEIDSYEFRESLTGVGFGFGARTFFNDIGYVQIQVRKIKFDQESIAGSSVVIEPDTVEGSIGIGFKY
jgi:hypothetical protein